MSTAASGRPSRRVSQAKRTACSVCGGPVECRGLCRVHYRRWRAGAPYDAPLIRVQKNKYSQCTIDGCERPHRSKGLCARHYHRLWSGVPLEDSASRILLGEDHPNVKLTADSVRRIRALRSEGVSCAKLAAMFNVADDTVRRVLNGRTWGHVH